MPMTKHASRESAHPRYNKAEQTRIGFTLAVSAANQWLTHAMKLSVIAWTWHD